MKFLVWVGKAGDPTKKRKKSMFQSLLEYIYFWKIVLRFKPTISTKTCDIKNYLINSWFNKY